MAHRNPLLTGETWKKVVEDLAAHEARYEAKWEQSEKPFRAEIFIFPTNSKLQVWGRYEAHLHIFCNDPKTVAGGTANDALLGSGVCSVRMSSNRPPGPDTNFDFHVALPPYPNGPIPAGTGYMALVLDGPARTPRFPGETRYQEIRGWWRSAEGVPQKVTDWWKDNANTVAFEQEWQKLLKAVEDTLAKHAPGGTHFDLSQ